MHKEQQEEEVITTQQASIYRISLMSRVLQRLCVRRTKAKFPELEELLPNPVQYKNAVCVVGKQNGHD
jgi:RNA processing factor Prp31